MICNTSQVCMERPRSLPKSGFDGILGTQVYSNVIRNFSLTLFISPFNGNQMFTVNFEPLLPDWRDKYGFQLICWDSGLTTSFVVSDGIGDLTGAITGTAGADVTSIFGGFSGVSNANNTYAVSDAATVQPFIMPGDTAQIGEPGDYVFQLTMYGQGVSNVDYVYPYKYLGLYNQKIPFFPLYAIPLTIPPA